MNCRVMEWALQGHFNPHITTSSGGVERTVRDSVEVTTEEAFAHSPGYAVEVRKGRLASSR